MFGRDIALPGARVAVSQILLAGADMSVSSAILYTVLPDAPGLSYLHVLSIYLAGFASGLFSGLPGGVGVFDSVLLLGLSAYLPPARPWGLFCYSGSCIFLPRHAWPDSAMPATSFGCTRGRPKRHQEKKHEYAADHHPG